MSSGSNVNSFGIPIDHDGAALEDFSNLEDGSSNPILINPTVLQEILSGVDRDVDLVEEPHLEADLFGGVSVRPSFSGGIPISAENERVDVGSEDESLEDMSRNVNPALVAAFVTNKNEREELYKARLHIMELQKLLREAGVDVNAVQQAGLEKQRKFNLGSGNNPIDVKNLRDELGLPIINKVFSKNFFGASSYGVQNSTGGTEADVSGGKEGAAGVKVGNGKIYPNKVEGCVKGVEEGVSGGKISMEMGMDGKVDTRGEGGSGS